EDIVPAIALQLTPKIAAPRGRKSWLPKRRAPFSRFDFAIARRPRAQLTTVSVDPSLDAVRAAHGVQSFDHHRGVIRKAVCEERTVSGDGLERAIQTLSGTGRCIHAANTHSRLFSGPMLVPNAGMIQDHAGRSSPSLLHRSEIRLIFQN